MFFAAGWPAAGSAADAHSWQLQDITWNPELARPLTASGSHRAAEARFC
jgi:hypothetical protein